MKSRRSANSRNRVSAGRPAEETSNGERAIDAFMAALEHPLKAEIEAVRTTLLGAACSISDDVKWNSLSFRTSEFFATVHLRSTKSVLLVFHVGAKKKDTVVNVTAKVGAMRWADSQRCLVDLGAGPALTANLPALTAFVREWIRFV